MSQSEPKTDGIYINTTLMAHLLLHRVPSCCMESQAFDRQSLYARRAWCQMFQAASSRSDLSNSPYSFIRQGVMRVFLFYTSLPFSVGAAKNLEGKLFSLLLFFFSLIDNARRSCLIYCTVLGRLTKRCDKQALWRNQSRAF